MMEDLELMLTSEQIELRDLVREFAQTKVKPVCRECEKTAMVPEDLVKEANEMGLGILCLPIEYGGLGLSKHTYAILREELARGDCGFATRVFGFGFEPVEVAGNEEQKRLIADSMVNGGVIALGLTESSAGSGAANMKTTARRVGDEYILNGSKTFITNGDCADWIITFAVTDKEKGSRGITAFMVPRDAPGFQVIGHEDKMGFRCAHTNTLFYDDMVIPAKYRIGEEGQGFKIAMQTLDKTRPTAGASAIGIAQQALEEALAYSKERVVSGHSICEYQGIAFMLADMEIQIQAARQLTWTAAKLADAGKPNPKISSAAKCFAGDMVMKVTTDAVQIFGGNGYSREYPVEKLMRDAKIYQIFEGTNQIQRVVISRNLLK